MTSYAFADLITFTRSTTATYVNASGNIASAAIDTHRIDYDPVALTPRGLLIEPIKIIPPETPFRVWAR